MNKKIIAIIGIIVVILILGFCFYTFNTVKVGNSYFSVPEGYNVVDEGDYVNLTSGNNYICLVKKVADENITKSIDIYTQTKVKNNDTLKFSKFNAGNVEVTKSVSNKNKNTVHYWFAKDGKTYEAFTWSGNPSSDSFLTNLINSMKPALPIG